MSTQRETYFQNIQPELRNHAKGQPCMVLDLDQLDKNISHAQSFFGHKNIRLVVKSLPSTPLLHYLADKLNTQSFMVFHASFLNLILKEFPNADVLLGKPFPQSAVLTFFDQIKSHSQSLCDQIQWLVDTPKRCEEYLHIAQEKNVTLKINLEIDIGLHRGGFASQDKVRQVLNLISNHPEHLAFSGFMGYEAHIASTPIGTKTRIEKSRKKAMKKYTEFKNLVKTEFPALYKDDLTFNSAGTQTYQLYKGDHTINDMCIGSSFLKPTDFDLSTHTGIDPALYIATPVIKKLTGTTIPFLESASKWLSKIIPSWRSSIFIYGGYWKAEPEYPTGLQNNGLYGRSSNQEIMTLPDEASVEVDDYVFLRPTQSEAVILQFPNMLVFKKGKYAQTWQPFDILEQK